MNKKTSIKSKAKKSPPKPSKPKSPKLPPKVIVSARVSTDVKKALGAIQKRLKHGNISETVAKAIEHYLRVDGGVA